MSHTPQADFAAQVLAMDWHDTRLEIKGRHGTIMYVRPLSGALPSLIRNVLVGKHHWACGSLYGRPTPDEFTPAPAMLKFPIGRVYPVTLLAALPVLDSMRPNLRKGLTPPPDIESTAQPVAIEGLPENFRATGAQLVSRQVDEAERDDDSLEALHREAMQHSDVRKAAINILSALGKNAPFDRLIDALYDEVEDVRTSASYTLVPLAPELPLQPFLDTIRDTSAFNEAALRVAARVFGAHADTMPVEAVIDLFERAPEPTIATVAVQVMGLMGSRAPVDILASILMDRHTLRDLRIRQQAANSLGKLGERAPLDALIAGMDDHMAMVQAATAVLNYPAPIPDDVRARAEEIVARDRDTRPQHANSPRPTIDPEMAVRSIFSPVLDVAADRSRKIPMELLQRMCGDLYSALTGHAAEALALTDPDALHVVARGAEAILAGQPPGPLLSSMVHSLFAQMVIERHIETPAVLAELAELLNWPYWQVRAGATWALAQFERPLPGIVRKRIEELMLDPESVAVRTVAMNAVTKLGSQQAGRSDE
jgi:HEAT repeat protein